MSTSNNQTYSDVRNQKIKDITNAYYELLNNYISTYNDYLDGKYVNGSKSQTEKNLKDYNTQLYNIAYQLKKNNDNVKKSANSTIKDFNFDVDKINSINNTLYTLQDRQDEYKSISNLSEQISQLIRHENKVFWIRLFIIIMLLFCILYLTVVIYSNENPNAYIPIIST